MQVLEESDCVKGGPYERCQWVGFSHMHFPEKMDQEMEEEMALAVDVRAILNMKVRLVPTLWIHRNHMKSLWIRSSWIFGESILSMFCGCGCNEKVSTLDLLLGVAFVLTASFAMHQLYRWCSERREYKRMSSANEAAPLLVPAKV